MIDFPTLFPNLVKYIPNWMERFYPSLAQFARGEGYPCGNKGVFIPRRNKCWTHPKTGNRLTKPLTYQKYQEAKEKSQKSRTEKGRTALQDREQGFRDKARERVKGWQNKKVETKPTLANEAKMRDTLKKTIAENELNKDLAETAYQKYHEHQNGMKRESEGLSSRSVASLYKIPHATAVARINGLRESVGLERSNAVSVDKELGERINNLLNDGKQIKINSSGGGLRGQKKEPSQTTIDADKKWSDFLESKNVTEKGLRKLDPETRKKITEEFENIRIEERAQESSKRKGLSLPEEPKQTPNSTGVKGAGGKSVDQQYKDIIASSKDPKGTDVSDSDKRSFESLYTTKLSSAQQLLNLEKNAKIAQISPSEDQKNYDKKQPDLNIDSGSGIMEGWRTVKPDGSVQGIPWSVKAEGQEKSRAIVGARLTDHPASPNLKRLRLYDADRRNETIDFKKGDRNASLRARRLVKEIAQGKSQEMESGDIKALIEGGNAGLAKRKVEKARLAAEDKQFKAALDDYLKSKNLTRESIKGLTDIGMDDLIEKVEKYQKSQSQTPNSTGVKGTGGKSETKIGKWNNKNFSPDDYIKEKDDLADGWFREGDKGAKEKYDQWVQNSMKKKVKLTVPGDVVATPDFMNMQRSGMINKNEIETKIRAGKELETLRTTYTFPSSFSHALQLYESQKPGVRKKIKFEFDGDLPDVPSRKKDFNASLKLANFAKPGCCCEASKPLRRRKTKQTPKLRRRGNRYA